MSMTSHINQTIGQCSRQLRLIKSCIKSLSFEAARTLVNSFVISRIDYCNSLLAGIPKCLLDRHSSNCVCWRSNHFVEWHLDTSPIFAVRHPRQKLDTTFGLRQTVTFVFAGCALSFRVFSVAGPRAWNKLPIDIRSCRLCRVFQMKT